MAETLCFYFIFFTTVIYFPRLFNLFLKLTIKAGLNDRNHDCFCIFLIYGEAITQASVINRQLIFEVVTNNIDFHFFK